VKYLLEKGADPSAKDDDGDDSLFWAFDSRHKYVRSLLLPRSNVPMFPQCTWNKDKDYICG